MRITLMLLTLLLTACGTAQPEAIQPRAGGDLNTAQAACLEKGYQRGSYDYMVCYQNRPEVQQHARGGRISGMGIINANRSPRSYQGRSYPVE
jgi:hypothetical protein